MTGGLIRAVRALLLGLMTLPVLSGCASQEQDPFADIGRAIAPQVDSLNGVPTAVLDEYRCDASGEACRTRAGDIPASALDASMIAAAFAEIRGIPVVRREDAELPRCSWSESEQGGTASGLWAEFVRPPSIKGDSAQVQVATVCMARSGFEQVHEFVLHFDAVGWKVVRRRLISIT
jgi:hypothetical protein